MLQDINKIINEQKEVWLHNALLERFGPKFTKNKKKIDKMFESGELKVVQNGLEFTLLYRSEVISKFKPFLNF